MTRSQLKNLIKECLVEILEEGLSVSPLRESAPRLPRSKISKSSTKKRRRRRPTDSIKFENRVNEAATHLAPKDPMLAAIFSDTAKTTLQAQYSASSKNAPVIAGSDSAAAFASENNPEDLFEGAENWASLAFPGEGTSINS